MCYRCVDVTLIIRYMLWNVYRMLAERHVVVPDLFYLLKKNKNLGRHKEPLSMRVLRFLE
jgi:hypothetical protein